MLINVQLIRLSSVFKNLYVVYLLNHLKPEQGFDIQQIQLIEARQYPYIARNNIMP